MGLTIIDILEQLKDQPEVELIINVLRPFIPLMKREGKVVADDIINFAVKGKWVELDQRMWEKMTDDERDTLSDSVLKEARDAVDAAYRRQELAKKIAFKVATSLITMLI